jgi:hypothetical protein
MVRPVYEVIRRTKNKRNKKDKANELKQNESWALKDILRGSYDSTVKFSFPAGDPPFTPNQEHNAPSNLLKEHKRFIYFVAGGPGDDMPPYKRERILFEILEGVHPEDAKLVVNMINKKTLEGISRPVIEEAFPGLLQD